MLVSLLKQTAQATGTEVALGLPWTMGAPYQKLWAHIRAYRRQEVGGGGVDMETSAMYALGQVREVVVCNVLVISGEVWQVWGAISHTSELKAATEQA